MKLFFILNPTIKGRQWDYREQAALAAKRYGWMPRFGEIDRNNPLSTEHLLRQAYEEGCTRIGVIGGDGTLHRVINTLARQKRLKALEVAPLPAGTCNDFSRFLGYHRKRLDDALRHACSGKAQETDLGQMDSELFINNAGIGRRPAASRRPSRPLQTLRNFRPIPLKATWEKGSIEGLFYMAMACNAPYFSGGLHFSKKPLLNDSFLDVYFLPTLPKWKLATHLLFGRLGKPVRPRQLITLQVKSIEIQAQTEMWPQSDGEPPAKAVHRVVFSVSAEKAMIVR
jgi:diacylglycerol kinase (ATP)